MLYKDGIRIDMKDVDYMLVEEIEKMKKKLEKQIKDNEPYEEIYKTSVEIDKLLVKYYNSIKEKDKKTT